MNIVGLLLENKSLGDIIMSYKKGQVWNKPLTNEMEQFEKETGKNAVYKGKITGSFEYWLWMEDRRSKGLARKRRSSTTPKPIAKREVEVTYVKFTPRQLDILTEKHKDKLYIKTNGRWSNIPYKQIKTLIRKIEITRGPIIHAYKEEIIKIFDIHKVPYNKKYIVKRKELI